MSEPQKVLATGAWAIVTVPSGLPASEGGRAHIYTEREEAEQAYQLGGAPAFLAVVPVAIVPAEEH